MTGTLSLPGYTLIGPLGFSMGNLKSSKYPTAIFGPASETADLGSSARVFEILEPSERTCPFVFSSPHSGRNYPENFIAQAKLDAFALRRSEDAFVDELFRDVTKLGAPLLRALFPRAFVDPNREPYELDPKMFVGKLPAYANARSHRVAGGLGTIPRVVSETTEIYDEKLPVAEALERIDRFYKPYHCALRALIEDTLTEWGSVLLIDCHSMPSIQGQTGRSTERMRADVVLGDRFGASCDRDLSDCLENVLRAHGFVVQRNAPYAGGFITEYYGNPRFGAHALQIEINRALYLDEATLRLTENFSLVKAALQGAMQGLVAYSLDRFGLRPAAE